MDGEVAEKLIPMMEEFRSGYIKTPIVKLLKNVGKKCEKILVKMTFVSYDTKNEVLAFKISEGFNSGGKLNNRLSQPSR